MGFARVSSDIPQRFCEADMESLKFTILGIYDVTLGKFLRKPFQKRSGYWSCGTLTNFIVPF